MSIYNGFRNWTKVEAENLKLGQKGFDKQIKLAGALAGRFCAVFNPGDSEINISLLSNIGDNYLGKLQPNATIYGDFKQIQVTTNGGIIIGTRL
tara:strand:- start:114 stop:395 length:282 start_codon:yes stop_codon:yes gene_type:complete